MSWLYATPLVPEGIVFGCSVSVKLCAATGRAVASSIASAMLACRVEIIAERRSRSAAMIINVRAELNGSPPARCCEGPPDADRLSDFRAGDAPCGGRSSRPHPGLHLR